MAPSRSLDVIMSILFMAGDLDSGLSSGTIHFHNESVRRNERGSLKAFWDPVEKDMFGTISNPYFSHARFCCRVSRPKREQGVDLSGSPDFNDGMRVGACDCTLPRTSPRSL